MSISDQKLNLFVRICKLSIRHTVDVSFHNQRGINV